MHYTDFINLKYKPRKNDLVCEFFVEPNKVSMREAAGAVASESSVGTWTELKTEPKGLKKLAAKVFSIEGKIIKVAYPVELFEKGNIPQLMSSVAGNVFGMNLLNNLRLEDIDFPDSYIKSFAGPRFGMHGVRKIIGVKDRPLVGTIIKPKLGLNEEQHAKVAYNAWLGGLDLTKEDENLASMSFNKFEKRQKVVFKLKEKVEEETGEKKLYLPNVTAESKEMIKRAKLVKSLGGEAIMVDVLTVGWSAIQTLQEENEDLKLILHFHRASHGAVTRNKKHGINMKVIAKLSRLCGADELHIGTAVGKMSEGKAEVKANVAALLSKMADLKPTMPVASGGLYPGAIPALIKIIGKDCIMQFGGGCHGFPKGTYYGAKAIRQAVDAVMHGIPLEEYAKMHKELGIAIKQWGIAK